MKIFSQYTQIISTILLTTLGLEYFLLHFSAFNIYRVLDTLPADLFLLLSVLTLQYIALKYCIKNIGEILQESKPQSNSKSIGFAFAALATGTSIYAYFSQFPAYTFGMIAGALVALTFILQRSKHDQIQFKLLLLIFGAFMNASLLFWMHEETNEGTHLKYAKQLAEPRDSIAENALKVLLDKVNQSAISDIEKEYLQNDYLLSNYQLTFKTLAQEQRATSGSKVPIIKFKRKELPGYDIILQDSLLLNFSLREDFRLIVYAENSPFKGLDQIQNYLFTVVDKGKITLGNSSVFNAGVFDIELPEIGTSKKIEWDGYDMLVYRKAADQYVLIGEPLSEFQVWLSNFGLIFSLFLIGIMGSEAIRFVFKKRNIKNSWKTLPIQFKIQAALISLTLLLFFVIAITTFAFLANNNTSLAYEKQVNIAKQLQTVLLENPAQLSKTTVHQLAKLSKLEQCEIDLYSIDGKLLSSSIASAPNSPAPKQIPLSMIKELSTNAKLVLIKEHFAQNHAYLNSHFGLWQNDDLIGIVGISAFESEIGNTQDIPIIMSKLLNVYVILLLAIWVSGLFLTQLLNRPLQLLAHRLSTFKLGQQNTKLQWQGQDEIGKLIGEYNNMVDKVETTRKELVRKEREGAWQVMAQQIAHEINNTLTPLRLNIQYMDRVIQSLSLEETASNRLNNINQNLITQIDHLAKIAAQFKLFIKMETGDATPFNLLDFLESYIQNYPKTQGIQYISALASAFEEQPIVQMDQKHLEQVLEHIFEFMENLPMNDSENIIQTSLHQNEQHVSISIQNNGAPIPHTTMEQLFDPKFSTRTSQSGLGLPLCFRIIEFYEGSIDCITETGKGTRFEIKLKKGINRLLEEDKLTPHDVQSRIIQ